MPLRFPSLYLVLGGYVVIGSLHIACSPNSTTPGQRDSSRRAGNKDQSPSKTPPPGEGRAEEDHYVQRIAIRSFPTEHEEREFSRRRINDSKGIQEYMKQELLEQMKEDSPSAMSTITLSNHTEGGTILCSAYNNLRDSTSQQNFLGQAIEAPAATPPAASPNAPEVTSSAAPSQKRGSCSFTSEYFDEALYNEISASKSQKRSDSL